MPFYRRASADAFLVLRWGLAFGSTPATHSEIHRLSLTGRVEVRILAHLALHLLALFFVIEQNLSVAEMAALDLALGAIQERFEPRDLAVTGELLATVF